MLVAGLLSLVAFWLGWRWLGHVQRELLPVIVPSDADPASIMHPSAGAYVARSLEDLRNALAPPVRPRLVVLSFDDGPFPVTTPLLVDQLQRLKIPADFFIVGQSAQEQPAIAQRVAAAGFEIGNHSNTHPQMPNLALAAQRDEIMLALAAIDATTMKRTHYFRPPHGNFNADTLAAARESGETVAFWNVDPGDWRTDTPDEIVDFISRHARAPAVILLHDGKLPTIEALPRIVERYRRAGFRFVTLSQLEREVPLDEINHSIRIKM